MRLLVLITCFISASVYAQDARTRARQQLYALVSSGYYDRNDDTEMENAASLENDGETNERRTFDTIPKIYAGAGAYLINSGGASKPVYDICFGVTQRYFYLTCGFSISHEEYVYKTRTGYPDPKYASWTPAWVGYPRSDFTHTLSLRRSLLSVVPNLIVGKKIKFYGGIGLGFDFVRQQSELLQEEEKNIVLDSAMNIIDRYSLFTETKNNTRRSSMDEYIVFQTGLQVEVSRYMDIRLQAFYMQSFGIESVPEEKRHGLACGIDIMINLSALRKKQ